MLSFWTENHLADHLYEKKGFVFSWNRFEKYNKNSCANLYVEFFIVENLSNEVLICPKQLVPDEDHNLVICVIACSNLFPNCICGLALCMEKFWAMLWSGTHNVTCLETCWKLSTQITMCWVWTYCGMRGSTLLELQRLNQLQFSSCGVAFLLCMYLT